MTNEASKSSPNYGAAAVGGGSIGTVIVGLAQLMPDTSSFRGFLITVTPALAVGISSAWIWVTKQLDKKRTEARKQKAVEDTRNGLLAVIKDPNTSPERLEQANKQLLVLEDKHFQDRLRILEA